MGGILVLSLGGMHHIDRRREAGLGLALYAVVLPAHPWLIGVAVVPI